MSFLANRQSKSASSWNLNWKEWEILAQHLNSLFSGARLERITVPERPEFASRFVRGDYQLHFSNSRVLWLSLRSQKTALVQMLRPRRAAAQASLPPWVQQAIQIVGGMRLTRIHALPEDRIIRLDFGPLDRPEKASLLFCMIPARPWATLLEDGIIVQSSLGAEHLGTPWVWQKPEHAFADPTLRANLLEPDFEQSLQAALASEAQEQALQNLARLTRERLKKLNKLKEHAESHVRSARAEGDQSPALWATTLLIHAHEQPTPESSAYVLTSEDGRRLRIPIPETWNLAQSRDYLRLARYYTDRARRLDKKSKESLTRLEQAKAQIDRLQPLLYRVLRAPDPEAIAQLEKALGISHTRSPKEIAKRVEKGAPGRAFLSHDGWTILLGRNKKENLELTLRFARGNDVWLHLRGAASAHAVIPVPPGKSVPLETLLDAAHLVAHASGRGMSRAEIDYTFRKNVKRIPKTDEVAYTQEKTLTLQPDASRIARLYGEEKSTQN